jgi:hypothetical protein
MAYSSSGHLNRRSCCFVSSNIFGGAFIITVKVPGDSSTRFASLLLNELSLSSAGEFPDVG